MPLVSNKQLWQRKSGFTLIEILISLGIFIIIISVVSDVFLRIMHTQYGLARFSSVNDNLLFVLEAMAREIRMGEGFWSDGASLSFTNQRGQSIVYREQNDALQRSTDGGISFDPITAEDVVVESLSFVVTGQDSADNLQPRISIFLTFSSREERGKWQHSLQTTLSPRNLDI